MRDTFRIPVLPASRLQRQSEPADIHMVNPKAVVTYNPEHKAVAKDILERLIPDLNHRGYFVRTVELSNANDATIVLNNMTYLNFNELKSAVQSAPVVPQVLKLSRRSP